MQKVQEYFGSRVFDDRVMKASLPAGVYKSLHRTIERGTRLDPGVGQAVGTAKKEM